MQLHLSIKPTPAALFAIAIVTMFVANSSLSGQIASTSERPPNIVFIMSDELAYFELSHMGNSKIHTPRIDQMAREGIRFTNALAGSPVCAPLRCTLMTGKHSGHASVRANDGGTPLRADEETIASILKTQGYATGGFGKWGCGGRDSTGVPEDHGFDVFFGYYDQVHAHSFYPPYLIRNSEEVPLQGNQGGRSGETYSHYAIMDEAVDFIRTHHDEPFFCYLPITPPHGMYDIPTDDPAWEQYENDDWIADPTIGQDVKNYAAMVTMVDNNVGLILDLLDELGIEENTIVFFTGDNGGQDRFRSEAFPRGYFGPNVNPLTGVEFRGGKGNLYEGGLKIPAMVRWPGKIEPGQESHLVFYQPDILPTLAELAGARIPNDVDGISILPEILGAKATGREQTLHPFLYWEFGQQVAVRQGSWKAIRPRNDAEWELYDLDNDPSESNNLAPQHLNVVTELQRLAEQSHEPVQPGRYLDSERTRHERDRWAKWGNSRQNPNRQRGVSRIQHDRLVPFDEMTLIGASSENRSNDRLAVYAIDGDPSTVWHTHFSSGVVAHPHELTIDLGATYDIEGIRYLARQDQGWNGAFREVEVAVGQTTSDLEDVSVEADFQKSKEPQAANLEEPIRGRYIRIKILSEVNGGPWASAADIGVIGSPVDN